MTFAAGQKLLNDFVRRRRAVAEDHVLLVNPFFCES
jgi:hypothetical protein